MENPTFFEVLEMFFKASFAIILFILFLFVLDMLFLKQKTNPKIVLNQQIVFDSLSTQIEINIYLKDSIKLSIEKFPKFVEKSVE